MVKYTVCDIEFTQEEFCAMWEDNQFAYVDEPDPADVLSGEDCTMWGVTHEEAYAHAEWERAIDEACDL